MKYLLAWNTPLPKKGKSLLPVCYEIIKWESENTLEGSDTDNGVVQLNPFY